jgi:predicted ATPase
LDNGFELRIEWDELEYGLSIGIARASLSRFPQDPFVRTEKIWSRSQGRRTLLIDRAGPQLKYRDDSGSWRVYPNALATNEALLSQMREPNRFPEVLAVRQAMVGRRF